MRTFEFNQFTKNRWIALFLYILRLLLHYKLFSLFFHYRLYRHYGYLDLKLYCNSPHQVLHLEWVWSFSTKTLSMPPNISYRFSFIISSVPRFILMCKNFKKRLNKVLLFLMTLFFLQRWLPFDTFVLIIRKIYYWNYFFLSLVVTFFHITIDWTQENDVGRPWLWLIDSFLCFCSGLWMINLI